MRRKDDRSMLTMMTMIFFVAIAWSISVTARAARRLEPAAPAPEKAAPEYEVKPGETLGQIALAHGVPLAALLEANGIKNPDRIAAGDKIALPTAGKTTAKQGKLTKAGVMLTVPKGFGLRRIAAAYGIPVKAILRANRIDNPNRIREGQKLLIPGAKTIVELVPPPPCFKPAVTFYRVLTDVTRELSLCFCNGRPNPKAIEELSAISGPKGTEVPFPLHPRLAVLLQQVADKFPGRRIEIISGQRVSKQPDQESYHGKGQALDFRLAGIANTKLISLLRTFDKVGVGYYPNSVFVHMDTREESGYWIDYSRQGEKPIYGRAGLTEKEVDAIRSARSEKENEKELAEVNASIDKLMKSVSPNNES